MDSTAFYIFLFIHVVSLIVGFGSVVVIDVFGLLWLFKYKNISLKKVNDTARITQALIWVGWFGLVLSGIGLITLKGYVDNLTKIKLYFVLLVGLNGIFLHFIKHKLEALATRAQMPPRLFLQILLTTAISQLGWWGALIIGFVHRHIEHDIPWPDNPYVYMVGISVCFGLFAGLIQLFTKKRN